MSTSIKLKTAIPGPKSEALVARRAAATSSGAAYLTQVAVESAKGCVVTDVDGNELLDFAGGIGVLALGHCPPTVEAAVQDQAAKLMHMCAIVATYEPYVEVAERLNKITPGDFAKKTMLANTGAEAVESAIKMVRVATGRQAILVFEGGYHGRSNLTLAMTSKYGLFKKGFGPFASEIYRVPFPNTLRRPPGMDVDTFVRWSNKQLRDSLIAQIDPGELAAIVIEPVQGEGGFVAAPASFLQTIRDICDENGIVMVADEIQSGFGRTGKMFAIEHSDVVPDLITTAKSLASGMPLAAVTGRAEIIDAPHPGGMGGTYTGNPVACVAAIESLKIIDTPEFLARATEIGTRMRAGLGAIAAKYPEHIVDVRGLGPMLAIELVKDPETLEPDPDVTLAITKAALAHGLIIIRAGLYSNCVRFLPPLVVSDDQIDEAMAVIARSVDEAAAEHWA